MKARESQAHGPIVGVTAENYIANARSFIRARDNKGFVIRQAGRADSTPAQWTAWMAYFEDIGFASKFSRSGYATVPAEWPEEFDSQAKTSNRTAAKPLVPVLRRSPNVRWRSLQEAIRTEKRPDYEPKPRSLSDLHDEYHKTPCKPLSDEARKAIAIEETA